MIKLSGYKKSYNDQLILELNNLKFNKTGFYLISGRSGCGKTTLLNSLSLLDLDFKGNYSIFNETIDKDNDKKVAEIRNQNISYIYQKPVLLNDFSCLDNILLLTEYKKERVLYALSEVGLRDKADIKACLLSGGEKQRLALAKAVALEKPIILADEPTGSLDKDNTLYVLERLKELSKTKLIIVVSHDIKTYEKYADYVIKISNKSIEEYPKYDENRCKTKGFLSNQIDNFKQLKKKYSKNIVKKRRFKNFLISFFVGLSLVCLSLTLIIGLNIKNNLRDGFSNFYGPNEIVVQSKIGKEINKRNSPSIEEIYKINSKIHQKEFRISYSNNFEEFFKDANSLHLINKYHTSKLEGFSARSFNEFKSISTAEPQYFVKKELKNDEIILSIDNQLMLQFCKELEIKRDFDSLFNYLKVNDVFLSLFIKNFDWQYEDEQIFKLVGFVVEPGKFIYHSNPCFSMEVFENKMLLPATDFDEIMEKPWYLKRNYIIKVDSKYSDLFYEDQLLSNYFIEKIGYDNFKNLYEKSLVLHDDYYCVYKKNKKDIFNEQQLDWINNNNIKYQFSNDYYLKNNLVGGFINEIFFVKNSADLDYFEDNFFKNEFLGEINIDKKIDYLCGGMLINSINKVTFKLDDNQYTQGSNLVVSSGFIKALNLNKKSNLYMIGLKDKYMEKDKLLKEYRKTELNISKIIDEEKPCIYVNKYGILNFFRDNLESKYEKYSGNAVFLEEQDVKKQDLISKYFYKYDVSMPYKSINNQIEEIINILEIILGIFSAIIITISLFLISLILKSFILDFKDDLFVLYCSGMSKKEIGKIFNNYLLNIILKSTLFMILLNVGINFLIIKIIENLLSVSIGLTFYYEPILITLILSIFMYFFSMISVKNFISKTDITKSIRN